MEVINVGISEYLPDQYQLFNNFHVQAVVGDGMRHVVPVERMSDKPMWIYEYKFFFWLSYYNQYEEINRLVYDGILDIVLVKTKETPFIPEDIFKLIPGLTKNKMEYA